MTKAKPKKDWRAAEWFDDFELPDETRETLKRSPGLSDGALDRIEVLVDDYHFSRWYEQTKPTPAQIGAALDEGLVNIAGILDWLKHSDDLTIGLIEQELSRSGHRLHRKHLRSELRKFRDAMRGALKRLERKPGAPRKRAQIRLAQNLAKVLCKEKIEIDSKPNGALCQILVRILDLLDETKSDTPSFVRQVLDEMDKSE